MIRWNLPPEGVNPWQWPWGRAKDLRDDDPDDGPGDSGPSQLDYVLVS